jgi:hypothetical protein
MILKMMFVSTTIVGWYSSKDPRGFTGVGSFTGNILSIL